MEARSCYNCANNIPNQERCKAMKHKVNNNCFAWADSEMLISRLRDIINYAQTHCLTNDKGSTLYKLEKELRELEVRRFKC